MEVKRMGQDEKKLARKLAETVKALPSDKREYRDDRRRQRRAERVSRLDKIQERRKAQ